jgi:hypothetical protein
MTQRGRWKPFSDLDWKVAGLIFLVMLLWALLQTAMAQPARSPMRCIPADVLVQRATGAVKEIKRLTPKQTERVLLWFNELPPSSNHTFDTFVVMVENDDRVSLFFGNRGLVCGGIMVPVQAIQAFLKAMMDGWAS